MQNQRFTETDFHIFQIPELADRMNAIRQQIQPKFSQIGPSIAEFLTSQLDKPFYVHIAKHARRTVHPPEQTWVAWAANKRGYKPYPHFQFGINRHSLFIWFSIFREYQQKKVFSEYLLKHFDQIWSHLPKHYVLSEDHTKEEVVRIGDLRTDLMKEKCQRLGSIKKAEFLCGIQIPYQKGKEFPLTTLTQQIKETFTPLLSLYEIAPHP